MEAATVSEEVVLKGQEVKVNIPGDAKKGTKSHVVVEGTDSSLSALTRYRRVVNNLI